MSPGRGSRRNAATNGGGKGGDSAQTGAALGTQVLRYSGIHGVGMVVSNVLTFAATVIVAHFEDPSAFGSLGLLLFFSGLLTLLFTLASKQGTLKRTFGGDDEDDDDEEDEDEELSYDTRRSFGTGLVTITIVSVIGTALSIVFAPELVDLLLGGEADPNLIVWAGLLGGVGALYRVTSIALWIERRPYSYIAVEMTKPVFTLAAVIPLLIGGAGIAGALAGQALGTLLSVILSVFLLRKSIDFCFEWREAIAIYRKGAIRVPLVLSMWTVGYADIFILSRFVSHADLGTYHLASKAGFLVAVLPGGYRKALRPLQKTPMFRAVEQEYGVGTARGTQFAYFMLMLAGTMLAVTVMANVLVRVAPPSYADAAPLIPLVAGGLVAPTVYRMMNKSVKYADKRVPFIIGAVCSALLFIGLSLVLVPAIGVKGTPLAMMGAFLPPTAYVFLRSQRGRSPISIPWRPISISVGLAVLVGAAHSLIDVGGVIPQIVIGIFALALWAVLCLLLGGVPAHHRGPLLQMFAGLFGRGRGFDPAQGLDSLRVRERKALRRAILGHKGPIDAVTPVAHRANGHPAALLVMLLRQTAEAGGAPGVAAGYSNRNDDERDEQIGGFLFAAGPIAERDQIGKRLINTGVADAFDLHTLEAVLIALRATPRTVWRSPNGS